MAQAEEARAGYGTAGDHWGVAASSPIRAQGGVHAGEVSTVATMTGGSPGGPRRGRRPAGPRRRDRSGRPRLARRATRGGCDDLTMRRLPRLGAAAVAGGTAGHAGGAPHPCGVAAAQQPAHARRAVAAPAPATAAAWQPRPLVAGKRRRADRAGGDGW
jgi:hypothetical protein